MTDQHDPERFGRHLGRFRSVSTSVDRDQSRRPDPPGRSGSTRRRPFRRRPPLIGRLTEFGWRIREFPGHRRRSRHDRSSPAGRRHAKDNASKAFISAPFHESRETQWRGDQDRWLSSAQSRQAIDAAQAPFGGQAGDRDQEIEGVVPQWRGPWLGDRCALWRRGSATNAVEVFAVDDLAVGFRRRSSSRTRGPAAGGRTRRQRAERPSRPRERRRRFHPGRSRSRPLDRRPVAWSRRLPSTCRLRGASGSASIVRLSPSGQSDLECDFRRYRAAGTRRRAPERQFDGRSRRVGLGTHGHLDPAGDVADQPADGLTPRSLEVALGGICPGACPSARGRRSRGRRRVPCRIAGPPVPARSCRQHRQHLGEDHGTGLDVRRRD